MKNFKMILPLLAVAISLFSVAFAANNTAQADNGPDTIIGAQQYPQVTKGYGSGVQAHASYVVSQDGGLTDIQSTTIKIYVPENMTSTSIQIHNYDMCTNIASQLKTTNSYDQSFGNTSGLAGSNKPVTNYVITGGSSTPTLTGHWSNSCSSSKSTLTLKGAAVDSSIGYRKYTLTATGTPPSAGGAGAQYVNLFWLSGADGVIFSQDSSAGVQSFGYQLSDPIPVDGAGGGGSTYFKTALPFGSACSVRSATTAQISFYDLDSGSKTVQPQDLHVGIRDVTAGNIGIPLKKAGGGGSLTGGNAGNQYVYTISGGNRQTVNVQFTAQPGHRYVLGLSNVYYNNTLQFRLPYDSIFYYATCQNANLDGNTTLDHKLIMPGQTANWTHYMANTDNVGTAMNVTAQVHRTIVDRNGTMKSNTTTPLVTNATIGPRGKNPNPPKRDSFTAQASDVGSTICEWISWTWKGGSGDNQSNQYCTVIAKQPKVHIIGGDVRVGGEVGTSSTPDASSGKTYGSWVEYGALIGSVTDNDHLNIGGRFGSGASLRGGLLSGGDTNPMTFSNSKASYIGQFGDSTLNDQNLAAVLKTSGLPATCKADSLSTDGCSTNSAASVSLDGATVGGTVYINAPKANVTITGDIKYKNGIASIEALPQVIIYAKSITIKSSVSQVDAWLLTPTNASGNGVTLTTCEGTPSSCMGQLTVNGPAATKNLSLPRSAGSDDAASQDKAAETFDLRADSYLWVYGQARQNYAPQTAQVTNLPPRY